MKRITYKQMIINIVKRHSPNSIIGYHADYRSFNGGDFKKGCFIETRGPNSEPRRFYANTYEELYIALAYIYLSDN